MEPIKESGLFDLDNTHHYFAQKTLHLQNKSKSWTIWALLVVIVVMGFLMAILIFQNTVLMQKVMNNQMLLNADSLQNNARLSESNPEPADSGSQAANRPGGSEDAPTPTPVTVRSSWNTHVSSAHGYSIRYPDDWFVFDSGFVSPHEECLTCGGLPLGFQPEAESAGRTDMSAMEYAKDVMSREYPYDWITLEKVPVPGVDAAIIRNLPGQASWDQVFVVTPRGSVLEFAFNSLEANIVDAILSTFRYTK